MISIGSLATRVTLLLTWLLVDLSIPTKQLALIPKLELGNGKTGISQTLDTLNLHRIIRR